MEFAYTVEEYTKEVSMQEFKAQCIDIARFRRLCEQCGNYNKRWSCPPFSFDPMEIWDGYSQVRIYLRLLRSTKDTQPMEPALAALMTEKKKYFDLLMAWEQETPGSLMLSAGTCDLCGDICARELGKPCCHLDKLRYSIEALGGNVEECARRYFGMPILWGKDGMAPDYYMLVGGLLIR